MRFGAGFPVIFYKSSSVRQYRSRKKLRILNMDYLQLLYARLMGYETQDYGTISHANDSM